MDDDIYEIVGEWLEDNVEEAEQRGEYYDALYDRGDEQ